MSKKNKSSVVLDCHICGSEWTCQRSDYKIATIKTKGGKHWKQYTAFCPICKREITITIPFEYTKYK